MFETKEAFRFKICFAVLSSKELVLKLAEEELEDYELNFLNLVSVVTKNSKIFLSNRNRTLNFQPGTLDARVEDGLEFDCGTSRSVSYYLEPLAMLSLFYKTVFRIKLTGITNDSVDLSVDLLKDGLFPLLGKLYPDSVKISMKVLERGFRVSGGGAVVFESVPVKKSLPAMASLPRERLIKRIRGTVTTSKVSTTFLNSMILKAREVFNDYIPDVWLYSVQVKNSSDHFFGISLHTDTHLVAEHCFDLLTEPGKVPSPESVAETACLRLLDEIDNASNLVSTSFQPILLTLMALSNGRSEGPSIGRVSEQTVVTLRLLRDFFGVEFHFKETFEDDSRPHLVTPLCKGIGLIKRTTEEL